MSDHSLHLPSQPRSARFYPTDPTDEQWALMEFYLPSPKTEGRTGRPRKYSYRAIVNGIFYVLRTGCTWDMMPNDLPPWSTCQQYFSRWKRDGRWERMHDGLREQLRIHMGRQATPTAGIIDSQSVKTAEKGGLKNRTLLAMMQESASKDVNAIFLSTPTDCSSKW